MDIIPQLSPFNRDNYDKASQFRVSYCQTKPHVVVSAFIWSLIVVTIEPTKLLIPYIVNQRKCVF
jgi:hypothetical protein